MSKNFMPIRHLFIVGIYFERYLPEDLYLCSEKNKKRKND